MGSRTDFEERLAAIEERLAKIEEIVGADHPLELIEGEPAVLQDPRVDGIEERLAKLEGALELDSSLPPEIAPLP